MENNKLEQIQSIIKPNMSAGDTEDLGISKY